MTVIDLSEKEMVRLEELLMKSIKVNREAIRRMERNGNTEQDSRRAHIGGIKTAIKEKQIILKKLRKHLRSTKQLKVLPSADNEGIKRAE